MFLKNAVLLDEFPSSKTPKTEYFYIDRLLDIDFETKAAINLGNETLTDQLQLKYLGVSFETIQQLNQIHRYKESLFYLGDEVIRLGFAEELYYEVHFKHNKPVINSWNDPYAPFTYTEKAAKLKAAGFTDQTTTLRIEPENRMATFTDLTKKLLAQLVNTIEASGLGIANLRSYNHDILVIDIDKAFAWIVATMKSVALDQNLTYDDSTGRLVTFYQIVPYQTILTLTNPYLQTNGQIILSIDLAHLAPVPNDLVEFISFKDGLLKVILTEDQYNTDPYQSTIAYYQAVEWSKMIEDRLATVPKAVVFTAEVKQKIVSYFELQESIARYPKMRKLIGSTANFEISSKQCADLSKELRWYQASFHVRDVLLVVTSDGKTVKHIHLQLLYCYIYREGGGHRFGFYEKGLVIYKSKLPVFRSKHFTQTKTEAGFCYTDIKTGRHYTCAVKMYDRFNFDDTTFTIEFHIEDPDKGERPAIIATSEKENANYNVRIDFSYLFNKDGINAVALSSEIHDLSEFAASEGLGVGVVYS
jgi:hypothetical protein